MVLWEAARAMAPAMTSLAGLVSTLGWEGGGGALGTTAADLLLSETDAKGRCRNAFGLGASTSSKVSCSLEALLLPAPAGLPGAILDLHWLSVGSGG